MRLFKFFLWALLASSILIVIGCSNERVGCNGRIVVQNQIPDKTLYVGGENLVRDLSEEPVVFLHTEQEPINIQVLSTDVGDDGFVVETERRRSDLANRLHVIVVKPNSGGEASVEIIASDDCDGNEVSTSFKVTVRDTAQQGAK